MSMDLKTLEARIKSGKFSSNDVDRRNELKAKIEARKTK